MKCHAVKTTKLKKKQILYPSILACSNRRHKFLWLIVGCGLATCFNRYFRIFCGCGCYNYFWTFFQVFPSLICHQFDLNSLLSCLSA